MSTKSKRRRELEAALNAANLEFQAETDSTMRGGASRSKVANSNPL